MYVKFKDDSSEFTKTRKDQVENKTLGLNFKKDEVRYETRGKLLVENGVADEYAGDYDEYLAKHNKAGKATTVKEAPKEKDHKEK